MGVTQEEASDDFVRYLLRLRSSLPIHHRVYNIAYDRLCESIGALGKGDKRQNDEALVGVIIKFRFGTFWQFFTCRQCIDPYFIYVFYG